MKKIFIIEDDKTVSEELSVLLTENGYHAGVVEDFENIYEEINLFNPDMVLLDINLPDENGFTICKNIRAFSEHIPIIFVASSNTTDDEVSSILSGGDDFISKPYNTSILLLKISRIFKKMDPINYREISVNNVILDLHMSKIRYRDKEIELTKNEFKIMYYLFLNPSKEIANDEMIEYLWNDKFYVDENILNVNITRIRKKLNEIGIKDFIKTIHGKGYSI